MLPEILTSFEVWHVLGWHFYAVTSFGIAPLAWRSVIQRKATEATYLDTPTFRQRVGQRIQNYLDCARCLWREAVGVARPGV